MASADVPSSMDREFEEKVIEAVGESAHGYNITFTDGWSFYVRSSSEVVPKVGDECRLYGEGIGRPVRGLVIAGRTVFYRTRDAQRAHELAEVEASKARRRAEFEAAREDHDRRTAALPPVFGKRFARFQANNPDFRWEFEGYELFACEEALAIVRVAEAKQWTDADLRAFASAPCDEQKVAAPALRLDEHSGNTLGFAVSLARAYLQDPELTWQMHGALANLVDCEAYGCPPIKEGASQ